jgi:flagellum-specific peptidoglycan hydrolase FlgJ
MMNFNFGGIKGAGPSGLTTACRTKEGSGETEHRIVDHFRAYRSADEGATDYLRLLQSRYPQALEAAKSGDSQAFVHRLKSAGYFTGSEEAYTRSVSSIANQAIERGFDSIGQAGHVDQLAQLSSAEAPAPSAASIQTVSVQAFTDELVRSALRIADDSSKQSTEASVLTGL